MLSLNVADAPTMSSARVASVPSDQVTSCVQSMMQGERRTTDGRQ